MAYLLAAAKPHPVGDPLAFYSVAATVIPVLFLAVVYEAKALERIDQRWRFHGVYLSV